jgi:alpha-L-fucosidase
MKIPAYLREYENIYIEDPRKAALAWFKDAKYGLFLHYGLYSIQGHHEWQQFREKIYVKDYEKLEREFTAENFDAEYIVDFAIDAGMKYVNLTTRHHDSFCLFKTAQTDFNSVNSPAGRDLVLELAEACAKKDIGLCLYYSHGRDWRHPHAPNNDEWGGNARPEYNPPEPSYKYGQEHDLQKYLDFMTAQITELLTNYGPIAAIWLDGVATPLSGDASKFKCQELYDHIHSLQPHTLVSYKVGVTGTEDFFAPEHFVPGENDDALKGEMLKTDKFIEICSTMTTGSWGWRREESGNHLNEDQVWEKIKTASSSGCNLLLNTGPLPDGSIDKEDETVLRNVGARIRREGFPA